MNNIYSHPRTGELNEVMSHYEERLKKLEHFGGGGGGGSSNTLEPRVARLESDMSFMRSDIADIKMDIREFKNSVSTDFRDVRSIMRSNLLWLLGTMGGGFILLLSVMAKGFGWW